MGLALIALSFVYINEKTLFPGIIVLPTIFGTALLLWAGRTHTRGVTKFLGASPFRYFGKISYSLYLVHWPVIVFSKQFFDFKENHYTQLLIFVVCIVLANISFHFIEQPFRQNKDFWSRSKIFVVSGAGTAILALLSAGVYQARGLPQRLPIPVQNVLAYQKYDRAPLYLEGSCFLRPSQTHSEWNEKKCLPKGNMPKIFLWGDSFAAHYIHGLTSEFQSRGYNLGTMAYSACPPLLGRKISYRPHCFAFNNNAMEILKREKPEIVILSANWPVDSVAIRQLEKTLGLISSIGAKAIVLGQGPQYQNSVPLVIAKQMLKGEPTKTLNSKDSSWAADTRLDEQLFGRPELHYVSVLKAACRDRECPVIIDGQLLNWDTGHFTAEGSDYFSRAIISDIMKFIETDS